MGRPPRYAVSYTRFSHRRQGSGTSIERQEEILAAYREANPDIIPLGDFTDKGISGFRGKHATQGSLGRLLELLHSDKWPQPRMLIIESVDRLGREPIMDALDRFRRLLDAGVTIVVCDMHLELDRESLNRDTWKLHSVINAMERAHGESKRKSDLVSAAWRLRIKNAEQVGSAVKGYVGPPWVSIDPATGKYGIVTPEDQEAAETVRLVFQWRIDGVSVHGICKRLNESGRPAFRAHSGTRKRQGFHQPYISELLKNRQVLGEHSFKAGEPISGYFPAVITPEQFHQAQKVDTPRDHRPGRKGVELSNLFTGVAKCQHCGGSMQMARNRAGAQATRYLMCSQSKRRFGCDSGGKFINYPKLEQALLDHLPGIPWSEIVRQETPEDPRPAIDEAIAKVEVLINEITAVRDRAQDLVLRGHEDPFLQTVIDKTAELKVAKDRHTTLTADRHNADREWGSRPGLLQIAVECRDAMNVQSVTERFVTRTRLADALRHMIRSMTCDAPGRTVRFEMSPHFALLIHMPVRRDPVVAAELTGPKGSMNLPMPKPGDGGYRFMVHQILAA